MNYYERLGYVEGLGSIYLDRLKGELVREDGGERLVGLTPRQERLAARKLASGRQGQDAERFDTGSDWSGQQSVQEATG